MPIIEGVGDEVTQFCMIVLCGIIAYLAWWSTAQRPHRFRTAVIVDRNFRHMYTRRLLPRHSSGRRHQHMFIISGNARDSSSPIATELLDPRNSNRRIRPLPSTEENTGENNTRQTLEETEMNNIVNAMDSDNDAAVLRNRRIRFFENGPNNFSNLSGVNGQNDNAEVSGQNDSSEIKLDAEKINNEDDKSDDKKNEETAKTEIANENKDSQSSDESKTTENAENNVDNIRIRLKFLNDDLRLVEGNLKEPLGDFKRRHFKVELNAQKLVRLIFNGQVLQREGASLHACGLFDNCVVHCLVHQPRTQQQFAQMQQQLNSNNIPLSSNNSNNNINNSQMNDRRTNQIPQTEGIQEERDWDLSHILFTMIASLLSIAWYIHIRFSSLFGVAASLAMFGLTGIYIIAVICVYFPDNHHQPTINIVNGTPVDTATQRNRDD